MLFTCYPLHYNVINTKKVDGNNVYTVDEKQGIRKVLSHKTLPEYVTY